MKIEDSLCKYNIGVESKKNVIADKANTKQTQSFEDILNEEQITDNITFSKHAVMRMNERDIEISSEEMKKLRCAIESADSKGISDSLILMHNKVFIVNIPSSVVVTVMDSSDINEQRTFTNIDGAVIT